MEVLVAADDYPTLVLLGAPLRDQRGDHVVRFGRRVFDTCHSPCLERSEDPWQMPEGIGRASIEQWLTCRTISVVERRTVGRRIGIEDHDCVGWPLWRADQSLPGQCKKAEKSCHVVPRSVPDTGGEPELRPVEHLRAVYARDGANDFGHGCSNAWLEPPRRAVVSR